MFENEDFENGSGEAGGEQSPQLSAEDLERAAKEIEKQQKALAKGFREIAERERRLEGQSAPAADEEEVGDLDPRGERVLDKYLDKRLGSVLQTVEDNYREDVLSEIDIAAEKAGIEADDLIEMIESRNLQPRNRSVKAAREVINTAVDIIKSKSAPSEEALRAKIEEEILQKLAQERGEGIAFEGVKPKKPGTPAPDSQGDVYDLSESARYKLLKERGVPSTF